MKRRLLLLYLALLAASHAVRWTRAPEPRKDLVVRVAGAGGVPVVLLHGSPVIDGNFDVLAPILARERKVLMPDLAGYGASRGVGGDLSYRAQARRVLAAIGDSRVHVVGYSMGGAVAIEMTDLAPERVASLTLFSAIGVEEGELLGVHELNHALHGLQYAAIAAATWLLPHFGALDAWPLDLAYARTFYEGDQRPLRGILSRYDGPARILHGRDDRLVPVFAAQEHFRILPQSEFHLFSGGHFRIFRPDDGWGAGLADFLRRVDRGEAATRAGAGPIRKEAAARPFDPRSVPRLEGLLLAVVLVLLAAATLASEDLATMSAGLLAARGSIPFPLAALAAGLGIWTTDLLLYAVGRAVGPALLRRAPLRWIAPPERVEAARRWLSTGGLAAIAASRFVPGSRLPLYLAAGAVRAPFFPIAATLLVAAAVWAPLLAGAAALLGREILARYAAEGGRAILLALAAPLVALWAARALARLSTWRGRRLALSRWRRVVRWEYWPIWFFYLPVLAWILRLAARHRSLVVWTAANPGIPLGGLVGESKYSILTALSPSGSVPPMHLVATGRSAPDPTSLTFPVVAKPDVGERGAGVAIHDSPESLAADLAHRETDTILQAYVTGEEYGVFYYRTPDAPRGSILGITKKVMTSVVGDGTRALETLILSDDRAVNQAPIFLERHRDRLGWIPPRGEVVELVRIGTHCRGALFLDATAHATDELARELDRISGAFRGFYFGRYDLRVPSLEDLRAGRNLSVLELNGVSSEATNLYDPRHTLREAYAILFRQWEICFAVGEANLARGARAATVGELFAAIRAEARI